MKRPLPLWLDFVEAPPTQRFSGYVLLAGSLVLAAFCVQWSIRDDLRVGELENRLDHLRHDIERQRLALAAAAVPATGESNRWRALFKALEGAAGDDVTLLQLNPGPREIMIDGEAKDLSAVLGYTARLHQSEELANAYLAKYEVVRTHPRQPVRFTILAGWRGAMPPQVSP